MYLPALLLRTLCCQNYVRTGIYAAVLYSAALMMIMVFHPGVDGTDPVAINSWHDTCTVALIIGIWPAAGLGALGVWMRYVYVQKAIRDRFRYVSGGRSSSGRLAVQGMQCHLDGCFQERLFRVQTLLSLTYSAAQEDAKFEDIFEFTHPLTVEIAVRCCRTWVDKRTLDEHAVKLAERMLKAGVEHPQRRWYQ